MIDANSLAQLQSAWAFIVTIAGALSAVLLFAVNVWTLRKLRAELKKLADDHVKVLIECEKLKLELQALQKKTSIDNIGLVSATAKEMEDALELRRKLLFNSISANDADVLTDRQAAWWHYLFETSWIRVLIYVAITAFTGWLTSLIAAAHDVPVFPIS